MRKNIMIILLDLILIALFNVVFFVLGEMPHPASVWISYGFIHWAYLMLVLTPWLVRRKEILVLGLTPAYVSSVYFAVEFVVGVFFILISVKAWKFILVFQSLIAGIYLFFLLVVSLANEHTTDQLERREEELQYVKNCSARLQGMLSGGITEKVLSKKIERAYDLIHASQSASSASVRGMELEVIDLIGELESQLELRSYEAAALTADNILKTAKERNRRLQAGG